MCNSLLVYILCYVMISQEGKMLSSARDVQPVFCSFGLWTLPLLRTMPITSPTVSGILVEPAFKQQPF